GGSNDPSAGYPRSSVDALAIVWNRSVWLVTPRTLAACGPCAATRTSVPRDNDRRCTTERTQGRAARPMSPGAPGRLLHASDDPEDQPMTTIDLGPSAERMAPLVKGVPEDQLGALTPCPAYTLGDLLDHVGGLALAFTGAATKATG